MLKTYLGCLTGSRIESEVYDTVINGQTSTAWPEPHLQNEIMFRLPKPLNAIDELEISGRMIPNSETLLLNLITGASFPDYQNIACQIEASFLQNKVFLRTIDNGTQCEKVLEQSATELFPDKEFQFIIHVNHTCSLDIYIGESCVENNWDLNHNLQDITYLTISNDITKVKELNFRYA